MSFIKNIFSRGEFEIGAPVAGEVIDITKVSDPTFSQKVLGDGIAVCPNSNEIVAPCDATVELMFDTGHAVTLTAENGAEILIHVGIDTVELKGKHFTSHVKNGDKVKKGDLLIEFDKEALIAEKYDTATIVVICNTDKWRSVRTYTGKTVAPGDKVIGLVE